MKLILSKISYHKSTSVEEHKRSDEREIIIQKKSFQLVKRGPQKVSILTILPRSWSIQRIQMEFSKTSKKKKTFKWTRNIIYQIYKNVDSQKQLTKLCCFIRVKNSSEWCLEKKDYNTVLKNGRIIQEQKYLVLCNLKEA